MVRKTGNINFENKSKLKGAFLGKNWEFNGGNLIKKCLQLDLIRIQSLFYLPFMIRIHWSTWIVLIISKKSNSLFANSCFLYQGTKSEKLNQSLGGMNSINMGWRARMPPLIVKANLTERKSWLAELFRLERLFITPITSGLIIFWNEKTKRSNLEIIFNRCFLPSNSFHGNLPVGFFAMKADET